MAFVGIVLVSHSAALAAGARDLLAQVAGPDVRVEPAGGTDDDGLGTSAAKIEAAVTRAGTGAGVLVLADLGSAVLTARAVLDDLPTAAPPSTPPSSVPPSSAQPASVPQPFVPPSSVLLVDAPFVEGAVAAAVIASTGADLATVAAAAREARDVPKF